MPKETAIIVGVGPGLGRALAKACSDEGMSVAAVARHHERVAKLVADLGANVVPYAADAADAASLKKTFRRIEADLGEPSLVVFNAGTFEPGDVLDIEPDTFERCWKIGCFGGFVVGQEAARRMLKRGKGTLIFTGATAALRGSKGFVNLAVPKFGLRALSQCLARELGPQGIHVAHVIIDGQIDSDRYRNLAKDRGPDSLLKPKSIAEAYMALHRQERSAWTQELDLRPWSEKF
jgi:NAD(P)-dependent dehydrogenase (short-subunit alcohol dehydrogenase family)